MSARVYVLLDVVNGQSDVVTQTLQGKPGVVMADHLEGPPDVILVLEARGRKKLAELTNRALAAVDSLTRGLQLLPAWDGRTSYSVRGHHQSTGRRRINK